jgi:LacI family transcriptional regulator
MRLSDERLGFSPAGNLSMARSGRRPRPKRIAIAIEMDEPYPHHLGCYRGIMRYAAGKSNWRTTLDPFLVGPAGEAGIRQYDGIVGRISRSGGEEARAAGIPVVNHWINSPARDLPSVLPDCREGGRLAAEHFLARGFRRFGYIGSKRDRCRRFHLEGFEPPLYERGFEVSKYDPPLHGEAGAKPFIRFYQGLKQWLADLTGPVALFVPLELNGLYIVQICGELGLRIPHDVGMVVGRDNLTICTQATPTISGIEDDNEMIGFRAAELLDRIMQGSVQPPPAPIWISPKTLRVRESSDSFVSKDPLVSAAMRFITEHSHRPLNCRTWPKRPEPRSKPCELRFARTRGPFGLQ